MDALLSSPSGRERYQRRREGRSVSPSPIKRPLSTTSAPLSIPSDDDDDDDEDEETLQLKLQAIEAKLKLKKLQQAKAKKSSAGEAEQDQPKVPARPTTSDGTAAQVPTIKQRRYARPGASTAIANGRPKGTCCAQVSRKSHAGY